MNDQINAILTPEVTPTIEANQTEARKEESIMNEVTCTVIDILTPSERVATFEAEEARKALAPEVTPEVTPAPKKGKLTEAERAEKKALQAQKKANQIEVKLAKQAETGLKLLARQEEVKQELKAREEEARQKKQEEARKEAERKEREAKEKELFGINLLKLASFNRQKSKAIAKKDVTLQDYFLKYTVAVEELKQALFNYALLSYAETSEEAMKLQLNLCFSLEKKALEFFNVGKKGIHCKANDIVYLTHLATKKGKIGKNGYKTTLPESPKMFQGLFESFALDRKEGKALLSIEEIEKAKAKAKEEEAKAKAEALLQ